MRIHGQASLRTVGDRPLLTEIFDYAARNEMESTDLIMVLAEAVAAVAATLDTHSVPMKISERLDAFVARVEERHPEIMQQMAAKT